MGEGVNLKDWRPDTPQFVEDVFDAAMAAFRSGSLEMFVAQYSTEPEIACPLEILELRALIKACRKAEEVERVS